MKIVYVILGVALGVGVVLLLMNRKQPATQTITSSRTQELFGTVHGASLLYENEERWKVVRDDSGRISDVVIHRKVEKDG